MNEIERGEEGRRGLGKRTHIQSPPPEESWTGPKGEERMEFSDPLRSGKDFYMT